MEETASEPTSSNLLQKVRQSFSTIYQKIQSSLQVYLLFFLVAALAILFGYYQILTHKGQTPLKKDENKNLIVWGISPSGNTTSLPSQITISFSDPIDEHDVFHFFEISPLLEGEFSASFDKKEITFKPKVPFTRGVSYSIRIKAGLKSSNNKPLLEDFNGYFYTEQTTSSIQFIKDDFNGKVLSFKAGDTVGFKIKKPADIGDTTLSVYKVSENDLLSSLTYRKEKQTYQGGYENVQETYLENNFDTQSQQAIQKIDVAGTEQDISLQLDPGLYYLKAEENGGNKNLGSAYFIVNSIGIVMRQDDKKVILAPFDLKTNRYNTDPVEVSFYNMENTPSLITSQQLSGLTTIDIPFDKRVDLIVGRRGDETLVIPVKLPQSQADVRVVNDLDQLLKTIVYTDRPIYKPGDTVHFRGVVRIDSDALYRVPVAGQQIRIVVGSLENPSYDSVVTTNDHGVFYGEFQVKKIEDSGGYPQNTQYLYASSSLDSKEFYNRSASAYFDIVSYIKPQFELQTNVDKSESLQHEKLNFTIKGLYFDGKPLKGEKISYKLYSQDYYETEKAVYNSSFKLNGWGGMCGGGFGAFEEYYGEELPESGEVALDGGGTATVSFKPSKRVDLLSQKITLVAEKEDSSGNKIVSAISTIVHAADFNVFYPPSATNYKMGDTINIPFYAEHLDGTKVSNTSFNYKLLYSDNNFGQTTEKSLLSGQVQTDENGKGLVEVKLPEETGGKNYLYLSVAAKDQFSNEVEARKGINILSDTEKANQQFGWWGQESQTFLKMVSAKNSYVTGDTISLSVNSPQDLDALLTLERGRVYTPRIVHLNKGQNTIEIPVTAELSPSITVVASFFSNGIYYTEGMSLNVPAMHKLLQVTVNADKKQYDPNETAILKITTRDASGNPVQTQLSLGVVDKAIYALRKSATPVLHSTFYAYRSRSTNASSSLTWVGFYEWGGGGGGGGAEPPPGKLIDTLYWNPNITTDTNGEAVISVPLKGITTTWKAVVVAATDKTDVGQSDTDFVAAP